MNPAEQSLEAVLKATPAPVSLKIGPIQWELRSTALRAAMGELLAQPDQFVSDRSAILHESWLVTVARVRQPGGAGSWLLRRSNYAKPSARKRDLFRTAAPIRAFRNALALEQSGIPTPRAMAAGVRRVLRVPRAGYLLTEEVPNATSLAQLTAQPAPIKAAVIQSVAEAIANLHQRGFIHGDLTINNVLLDAAQRPWFIDLERTRTVRGEVGWRQAVEDFHRFARHFGKFSPAGKRAAVRLLHQYCHARGWAGRERAFIRAMEKRLRHKIEQNL